MTILQFPQRPELRRRPSRSTPSPRASRSTLVGPDRYYPRRFHPLRERAPFLIPTLLSALGTVLVLGAAAAMLEILRSSPPAVESPPGVEARAAD